MSSQALKQGKTPTPPSDKSQLNLKTKLLQRSIRHHVDAIDWEKGSDAPLVVEFDPTTACNLACPDCISRDLLNQGFFSRDRIRDLTREMVDAGVRAVVLIGGGEPLAHPEIGWVIDYLGEHGVSIGLTTNGLLMHRYLDSIAEHCDWVRVSMDAATSETFHRIRPSVSGKPMFDKAIENMRKLAEVKKGTLGYSFMIYSEGRFDSQGDCVSINQETFSNVTEIYRGAEIAKDIGCDYYEIKPMYDINHYSIVQNRNLMEIAREQSERAMALQDEHFRVLQATKLHHIIDCEGNLEPKDYTRCAVSQLRTLVTPSGTYVCPYFRGRDDKNIGDVRKRSFKEMWHGQQRAAVMGRLNPSVDCKMHCIRHDSNLMLEDMIVGKFSDEVIDDYDNFI